MRFLFSEEFRIGIVTFLHRMVWCIPIPELDFYGFMYPKDILDTLIVLLPLSVTEWSPSPRYFI